MGAIHAEGRRRPVHERPSKWYLGLLSGAEGAGPRSAPASVGGEQQRLAISRAMMARPTMLLWTSPRCGCPAAGAGHLRDSFAAFSIASRAHRDARGAERQHGVHMRTLLIRSWKVGRIGWGR